MFGFTFLLFMWGEKPFPFLDEMFFFGVTDNFHVGGESSGFHERTSKHCLKAFIWFYQLVVLD